MAGVLFIREFSQIRANEIMATLKIELGSDGNAWVTLTRFSADDLARLDGTTLTRCEKQRIMDVPSEDTRASVES